MNWLLSAAVVVAGIVAVALIVASVVQRYLAAPVTVFEYESGLRFERGRFVGIVGPGRYWLRIGVATISRVDMRARVIAIAGQEVLSADGVALKTSIAATYRLVDLRKAVLEQRDYESALHTTLQLALRAIISAASAEDLLARRATVGAELLERARDGAAALGVELISADLKDLTLPGDLKKVFAQVVRARQEGLASLERARGETAALRSLANAARMVDGNPQLLQLRWMQVLGEKSGNTVVLGVPSGTLPIRAGGGEVTIDKPSSGADVSEESD